MKPRTPTKRFLPLPALCGALLASLFATPLHATPTLLDTIALSPGADTGGPSTFALNATTHKLYVLDLTGLKVIDTTIGAATAGIKLTAAPGDADYDDRFGANWLAADGGTDAPGNKVYTVGFRNDSQRAEELYVHVVDGATNTSLTPAGGELDLGLGSGGGTNGVSAVVNPATHKVYVATGPAIVVIDGPNLKVLSKLVTGVDTATASAINRATGKLYFFSAYSSTTMAIVDGATDTFTTVAVPFVSATAAVVDESTGRVYVYAHDRSSFVPSIYMLDANGTVLGSTSAGLNTNSGDAFGSIGFDPGSHVLYVSNGVDAYPQPSVTALDASTLAVKTTYAGRSASSVVFDSGRAFLLNRKQFANAVGTLTPSTGAFSQTTVAYTPGAMAIDAQRSRAYVYDYGTNEVPVIDANTSAVVNRFTVALGGSTDIQNSIAVSSTLNRFYRTHLETNSYGTEYLDSYDGSSGQLVHSVALVTDAFAYPGCVAVDDTHGVVYVTGPSAVYALNADSNALIATIPNVGSSGGADNGLAVNPVTRRVYVSAQNGAAGQVVIIDGTTNKVVTTVATHADNPGRITINTKTNKVYVANYYAEGDQSERNQIDIIDGATDQSAGYFANVSLNGQTDTAVNVAVDEVTNTVYVADPNNDYTHGRVTAFDAGNNYAYLGEVELGRFPSGVVFDPKTRNLLVSNHIDGTVSRLHENSGAASHPAFFNGEVALGQGVYYLAFPGNGNIFGYYEYLSDPRYVYHFDLGFEYVFDLGNGGVVFYDFASNDYFYTSPTFAFPYLYDFGLQAFLYYYPDPTNPQRYNSNGVRYFYNFATKQIISK